jgi:hypothetical protein
MVNHKGIASYCQNCGLCSIDRPENDAPGNDTSLVDIIIDEILRTMHGREPEVKTD